MTFLVIDLRTDRIMLVVIKSTSDPSGHIPALKYTEDKRVETVRYILVDRTYSHLIHCHYNTQTLQAVAEFISNQ